MKYDSGMTYYHKNIIAALQMMCRNNIEEITEKFSPNDGSPTPLREYLKQKYGKSYTSMHSGDVHFTCSSTNFNIMFDNIQNSLGDKNLTLSWSQTAKFIRDNWDEVFKKSNPQTDHIEVSAEKQPSYLDKLRERYPKINETDKWFDTTYCPNDIFDGENVKNIADEDCEYGTKDKNGCQKCWHSPCAADADFYEELGAFEKDYYSHYPAEADTAPEISEEKSETDKSTMLPNNSATCENQVAVHTETTLQNLFDYSELDNDTAKNLRECERIIRQETAGYFTLLGAKFKEAQSLLADHASGTFEKWYTAMGFKRQTVYNLIQRYDFSGSPTIGGREDTFEALPLTLSYEVSKPDAPAELVEKVLDGDITTNAEYLKLKAELDRTREECRQLDANSAAKDKEYQREIQEANKRAETAEMQSRTYEQNYHRMAKNFDETCDKNIKLEQQIKELESRPTDVTVQQDEGLLEELKQLREENERLKNKDVKNMLISLTMDELSELIKALGRKPQLQDIIKRAKIIKL